MSYKTTIFLLLALSILTTIAAWSVELLPQAKQIVDLKTKIALVDPLYYFGLAITPSLFILCFLSRDKFVKWLTFNLWYLPVVILLITLSPYAGSMEMFWDKVQVARFFAVVHVLISLYIFFVKRNRNTAK